MPELYKAQVFDVYVPRTRYRSAELGAAQAGCSRTPRRFDFGRVQLSPSPSRGRDSLPARTRSAIVTSGLQAAWSSNKKLGTASDGAPDWAQVPHIGFRRSRVHKPRMKGRRRIHGWDSDPRCLRPGASTSEFFTTNRGISNRTVVEHDENRTRFPRRGPWRTSDPHVSGGFQAANNSWQSSKASIRRSMSSRVV